MKNNFFKNSKYIIRIVTIFIAICILITVFCFQYYRKLHSTIREESKNYLQEVSRRIGNNIDRIIDDNYGVLYTMASSLESMNKSSLSEVRPVLQKQKEYWNYESIMLIDDTGKAYSLDNKEVLLNLDKTVRAEILNGQKAMSTSQIINNQEFIVFTVPLNNIEVEGKVIVALAASYSSSSFDQVLSMTSFEEKAYSQIINKNGAIIIRSSSPYATKTGYNIFTSIQNAKLDAGSNLERLKDDIANDVGDQIGLKLDGVHLYMVYTPIQPDEWYLLTFVPVQAVNQKSDMILNITLLMCGLITFAFAGLVTALLLIFNNNKRKLEKIAYMDEITKGNTIQFFYSLADNILKSSQDKKFALVYTNIEKFKVLNDQLGRQTCDKMLKLFNDFIESNLTSKECIGRIAADNFCLLIEYPGEGELLQRFEQWNMEAEKYVTENGMSWGVPSTGFGIYVIENYELTFPQMIDRAKLALKESSWSIDGKMHYAFYDDEVRRQMYREKQLEDKMESALRNTEFQVYLQPKYRLPEEVIGGAEALVRWVSSDEGMIFPNEFIPLFEKNGFIVQLDLWVFEQVCRTVYLWLEKGLTPMKISVNCSRVHFKDPGFLGRYIQIVEKYAIDRKYIEIELTESVVFENSDRLIRIIEEIREAGFGCSMDDFGSGYSSLNLIQSIPVDTLKLDKIFFKNDMIDLKRTEAIVTSIVSMAKAISMETVAEGVEHREQVEMLKRTGCNYIQGFVFAKPMKISEFEALAFGREV